MKVLIAYDGSSSADAAVDDLRRAGLPSDTHLLIISAAGISDSEPTFSEYNPLSSATQRVDAVLKEMRRHEAQVLKETRAMLAKLVPELRRQFPGWTVQSEVLRGDPADVLLKKIDEWGPDLAMGGSQGRSAIGRFFFGSLSKLAAEKANCSVRIVKRGFEKTEGEPVEIILAAKNPAEAERLVSAVGRRVWPDDTRIRLIAADDNLSEGLPPAVYSDGRSIYETAAQRLASVCLTVSIQIESGDPQTIFLAAADAWRADAIFACPDSTGVKGLNETTSSLVTSSKCTVEVVR